MRYVAGRDSPTWLPGSGACPLCRKRGGAGRVRVYEDRHWGGAWLHCPTCAFSGDLVEWVGATSGESGATATTGLLDVLWRGTDRDAACDAGSNHDDFVAPRANASALFAKARDDLAAATSEAAAAARDALGVAYDVDGFRRGRGASRHVGFVGGREFAPPDAGTVPAGCRGWRDFVSFPAYDLPGRLWGFFDRRRDGAERFRPVGPRRPGRRATPGGGRVYSETGVTMLADALAARPTNRCPAVAAIGDVWLAARLQAAWLRDHDDPLPVVGWSPLGDVRPTTVMEILPAGSRFWAPRRIEAIRAAAAARDGLVVADGGVPLKAAGTVDAGAALDRIHAGAEPWRDALLTWLPRVPAVEADEGIAELALPRHELAALARRASGPARERLRAALATRKNRVCAVSRGTVAAREPGKWIATGPRGDSDLSNFAVRIERVTRFRSGRDPVYDVVLEYAGREVPLRFVGSAWTEKPLAAIREAAAKAGEAVGLRLKGGSADPCLVLDLAALFHAPDERLIEDRLGWSSETSTFVFPRYSIAIGGTVTPAEFPDDSVAYSRPFRRMGDVADLDRLDVAWLSRREPKTAAFWAAALPTIAATVAPACRLTPPPTTIVARDEEAVLHAAVACGCTDGFCAEDEMEAPAVGSGFAAASSRAVVAETVAEAAGRIVSPTDAVFAAFPPYVGKCFVPAAPVVAAYVRDLAARRLCLPFPVASFPRCLAADVRGWFVRIGGDPAALDAAIAAVLHPDDPPARRAGFLLSRVEGIAPNTPRGAYVSEGALLPLFGEPDAYPVEWRDVRRLFLAAGGISEPVPEFAGYRGWTFADAAVATAIRDFRYGGLVMPTTFRADAQRAAGVGGEDAEDDFDDGGDFGEFDDDDEDDFDEPDDDDFDFDGDDDA